MRIPLTKYGLPEVVVYPAAILALMIVAGLLGPAWLPLWTVVAVEAVLAMVLGWALMFFRDPYREPPGDDRLLLSPADGTVTDVEMVQDAEFVGGPALRVGIFLSIFNTHINRAPCDATIEKIIYRPGKYLNAMSRRAGKVNESNNITMVRTGPPQDRLLVRQISGAIARRIVCAAKEGQRLAGGEPFGMIKFGSRTELYLSPGENVTCLVRIGDKVKAGVTPLIKYDSAPQPEPAVASTDTGS
ncbi:MAG: phosphatidylserine decarboxylase family protein [Phycisphaerae bacterium]|nr:phosphatidylserine decarboxylase family protein [Phycisphaerae bacterium]